MKAIMISIKPKWCALMMNGIKTKEVRKNKALASAIQKLIDEYGYAEIYVHCTKQSPWIYWNEGVAKLNNGRGCIHGYKSLRNDNGKVLFKFRCYNVEEILITPHGNYYTNKLSNNKLQTQSCLSNIEIFKYTNCHITIYGYCVCGYAIHISDLEIFDKPKELNEFYKVGYLEEKYAIESHIADIEGCDGGVNEDYIDNLYEELDKQYQLTKAPQNFCYIESEE